MGAWTFVLVLQTIAAAMPFAHGLAKSYSRPPLPRVERSLLAFASSWGGGHAVDLSLRLEALVVCAVFVFVGAILLGAF